MFYIMVQSLCMRDDQKQPHYWLKHMAFGQVIVCHMHDIQSWLLNCCRWKNYTSVNQFFCLTLCHFLKSFKRAAIQWLIVVTLAVQMVFI